MCGISGIFHYNNDAVADADVLRAMTDVITHRGPDEEGFHIDGAVGLGMRRLIIIDLSTGQQPLYNEDRSVALVFNGEIYNFPALRARLIDRGHRFSSRSDGEVIVHLYEEEGVALLERLRGMFAFALWDAGTRRVFVARDRIGIKPLYYADFDGTLLFASEPKSILQFPGFPRSVDTEGLHHYLSLNYVPAPFTLIQGIKQILPGHYITASGSGIENKCYWDLRFVPRNSIGEKEWATRVREKLRECVESHLISDVPFGAFLSGGIDSSAIVGLMTEVLGTPVSTFSIDFEEESYSEAPYAHRIAERFESDHHELRATPDVIGLLDSLIWYADDPLADSSMVPVYMIAEYARRHVTMVLTGDGGDEVFAGYETYNAYFVRRLYRRLPPWIRRAIIRSLVEALPVSLTKVSFDFKAKRFVAGAELDEEESHFWWRSILSEMAKRDLYTPALRQQLDHLHSPALYREYFARAGTTDPLNRMLYVDSRFYLPNDMLVKVDRMTMAHGLEARVPFLDHELVELGAAIPTSIKFRRRRKKYILKKAMSGLLPDAILNRKKAGFNVPVNAWLAGDLNPLAHEILSPDRIAAAGFFRPEYVQTLLAEHERRRADHSYALWGLICFQLWYERFISADRVVPPKPVADRWGIRSPDA